MILHLFHDDKICNRIVSNFDEALPGKNIFVCIGDKKKLKHVDINNTNIVFVDPKMLTIDATCLDGVDKILIHYLDYGKMLFINRYFPKGKHVKIYWALWGGDLYSDILYSKGYEVFYEPQYEYVNSPRFKIKEFLKSIVNSNESRKQKNEQLVEFISVRIDVILTSKYEYAILKKYIGREIKAGYLSKGPIYYPIEEVLGSLYGSKATGTGIMIGNSASGTNNHVYAMEYLSKLNTKGRTKNAPLSYAGIPKYIEHVKTIGYNYWKDEFNPIENFMTLENYNKLMLSNNVFVYGNWRQEAAGNIVVALFIGAKVFISEKSPLYERFIDYGVRLYKTEYMTQSDIDTPEDENVICENRNSILRVYSKDAVLRHIVDIFG